MFRGKHGRPEKLTLEFVLSKEAEEDRKKTKEWELLQNPVMNLNRGQRALMGAEEELIQKREKMKKIREKLDAKWNDLAKDEDRFKDSFIKFNKFVRENANKTKRARDKMNDAERYYNELSQKVDEMEQEHKRNKQLKLLMDERIKEHHMYEDYLKKLCTPETGFKSPDDIIARFEIYLAARAELMKRQQAAVLWLDKAEGEMQRLIEWGTNGLVGYYTKLAAIRSRHDNAIRKTRTWENLVKSIRDEAIGKFGQIDITKGSIWNIYRAICYRRGVGLSCKRTDVESQLFFVKLVLSEFKTIQRLIKKRRDGRRSRSSSYKRTASFRGSSFRRNESFRRSTITLHSVKSSETATNK